MPVKEATARIKINKLLEAAGWRFFDDATGTANIQLEPKVKIKTQDLDALGSDFEKSSRGFIDFLLLNEKGFPFIVLEAKAEDKNPLVGKEQARKYAKSQNCRFIILSNGNLHYFWDLERGDPHIVTAFPSPTSVAGFQKTKPDTRRLVSEVVESDYVALTQMPHYASQAAWSHVDEREQFVTENKLRFLRPYQLQAMTALQAAVQNGKDRFLFEMATGTGKTLTAAAIIKLFLRTGNAQRVLFLVDRLELEDQAQNAFVMALKNSFKSVIYKENRDDWRHAEIVVTTVQSLLFNNKYQKLFSPTDFDLVISDEAHRSIGGNARAVFNYFVGFKLGLTATPRDYLKNLGKNEHGQRELERRLLLDTYRTFGCDDGQPTFRYSLLDGVRGGYLINPTVVDARSSVTTQLLSEQGLTVEITDSDGNTQTDSFGGREFEKRFFSEATNQLLCKTFLENALRDPVSGEIGKSIVFAVSQNHAAKLTQILNEMAARMFPAKYQSDFAVQVTSHIPDAQQFTSNFSHNNLLGSANFNPLYKTSKARVCVTVGMMTTGYDCPDLLNLGLFRPIFSPTDFIQIKGRGTRKHNFFEQLFDDDLKATLSSSTTQTSQKTTYKLFDFFANCEYFEQEFKYDEVLKLPKPKGTGEGGGEDLPPLETYEHQGTDYIHQINEEVIGLQGMKIDRMFYDKFEDTARSDKTLQAAVAAQQWELAEDYIKREIADKPTEFYNLDKLRRAAGVDRRLSWREILEKAFGLIDHHKSTDELLEEEFSKFVSDVFSSQAKPEEFSAIPALKNYFKAYATSDHVRHIIKQESYADLATHQPFSSKDFRAVPQAYRQLIPSYIKDYVSLNQFL